jgi:hypothetical protein
MADLERFCASCWRYNRTKRQTARCWTFACRPVANDVCQTARCRAACCRDVTLSVQIEGLAYKPSDRATTRCTITRRLACLARDSTTRRQSAIWRFVVLSLATRRKGGNDISCVVAINNATRNVPNQPP